MDEPGVLRLKRRLHCGPKGRLLEWHPRMSLRAEREMWGAITMWIRSSKHLELRTSNLRSFPLSLATFIPID
jgi:hypothetical protein